MIVGGLMDSAFGLFPGCEEGTGVGLFGETGPLRDQVGKEREWGDDLSPGANRSETR